MPSDEGLSRVVGSDLNVAGDTSTGHDERRLVPSLLSARIDRDDADELLKVGGLESHRWE